MPSNFIVFFNTCLLSTYFMPSTVLDSRDAELNKTRHILSCEADFIIWETGQWGERGVCVGGSVCVCVSQILIPESQKI